MLNQITLNFENIINIITASIIVLIMIKFFWANIKDQKKLRENENTISELKQEIKELKNEG